MLNSPSSSYTTATAQGRGAALLLSPGQESSTGSPLAGDRHVNAATANGGAFPPSPSRLCGGGGGDDAGKKNRTSVDDRENAGDGRRERRDADRRHLPGRLPGRRDAGTGSQLSAEFISQSVVDPGESGSPRDARNPGAPREPEATPYPQYFTPMSPQFHPQFRLAARRRPPPASPGASAGVNDSRLDSRKIS